MAILRQGTRSLATLAQRRLTVQLEVHNKDRSYPWLLEWMSFQARTQRTPSTGFRIRSHELSVETVTKELKNGSLETQFSLIPGVGTHWVKYRGSWMRVCPLDSYAQLWMCELIFPSQVVRSRESKSMDRNTGRPWETVTLTALRRDQHLFPLLLAEGKDLSLRDQEGKLVIYTAWNVEWAEFGRPRAVRDIQSVVLADGVSERIENDLRAFLRRSKWYSERGSWYRYGFLSLILRCILTLLRYSL